jgi:hypothetical protein
MKKKKKKKHNQLVFSIFHQMNPEFGDVFEKPGRFIHLKSLRCC